MEKIKINQYSNHTDMGGIFLDKPLKIKVDVEHDDDTIEFMVGPNYSNPNLNSNITTTKSLEKVIGRKGFVEPFPILHPNQKEYPGYQLNSIYIKACPCKNMDQKAPDRFNATAEYWNEE